MTRREILVESIGVVAMLAMLAFCAYLPNVAGWWQ